MLTDQELQLLEQRLSRKPLISEIAVFDAMWSEHCSYKSSKKHLATLYNNNKYVLAGPGENAGVISIGGSDKIAFKMESHNHPSYIEPFQGAATGVGGILRDVFTMGFRPIALTNNLFFGDPVNSKDNHRVMQGVISGLTHYGNCVGVPTVSSDITIHQTYSQNPLVNAMAVGHTRQRVFTSKPKKAGKVYYVGAKTGRDGIGGAVMASDAFTDDTNLRPTVQVGDPYLEKLLIEACLELFKTGKVIAAQDMGAAGITSTTTEIAIKGNLGIELDLDKVPLREKNMEAWEILLSESQERMLFVLDDTADDTVFDIFRKWDLDCVEIGHLSQNNMFKVYKDGEISCNFPLDVLDYPLLDRPTKDPGPRSEGIYSYPFDYETILSQYDSEVQGNTVKGIRDDVAVIQLADSKKKIAIYTACFPQDCYSDPKGGTRSTINHIFKKLKFANARPLALTNCLNFGNPENPKIMWEFTQTIQGMKDMCTSLDFPIVSGNVSFYNETNGDNIMPTPVFGAIGLMED